MKRVQSRELQYRFKSQLGLIRRSELRLLGVSAAVERTKLAEGEWQRVGRRVIRLAGSPATSEQMLLAACLEAGPNALASHRSAAWLWGLAPCSDRPAITIGRNSPTRLQGIEVHRPLDLPERVSAVRNIPCTNPLRTLRDLAGVCPPDLLDEAIDVALARRLITVEALEAEIERTTRAGRTGVGQLRRALQRRGLSGAPHPSVLESRVLRLLRRIGIVPMAVEVKVGSDGRYRVDTLLDPNVAMEVDGYTYHAAPELKAEDERRRGRLRLGGMFVLVYDWTEVLRDGRRIGAECHEAIARYGAGSGRRPSRVS
jgi:hypothetical protein